MEEKEIEQLTNLIAEEIKADFRANVEPIVVDEISSVIEKKVNTEIEKIKTEEGKSGKRIDRYLEKSTKVKEYILQFKKELSQKIYSKVKDAWELGIEKNKKKIEANTKYVEKNKKKIIEITEDVKTNKKDIKNIKVEIKKFDNYTMPVGFGNSTSSKGAFELSGTTIKETGLTGISTNDFVVGADDTYNTTSGERMFFDSSKGAFRAGYHSNYTWGESAVGYYSSSTGLRNKASGWGTSATGIDNIAIGDASDVSGRSTYAYGIYSSAKGYKTTTASTSAASTIVGMYGKTNENTVFAVASGIDGDELVQGGGLKFEVRRSGGIIMKSLPTSSTGLEVGALWNNNGVVNIIQ